MSEITDLSSYPLLTRMLWYATLNSWKNPPGFPWPLPAEGPKGDDGDRHKDPRARQAFQAVSASLTDAEQSLAWWLHSSLKESPENWAKWWSKQRGGGPAQAEQTVAAYYRAIEQETPV